MIIARWHIDARFGQKPAVVELLQTWCRDIASQIGWKADKLRLTTGSVGALESTVELEVTLRDLAELDASWTKLGTIAAHKQWGTQIEPCIVSGTPRWEIYRVI